jgi:hypothetical protein
VVRQPDATLLALPILDCLLSTAAVSLRLRRIAVMLIGFVMVFCVQMAAWQVLNGNLFSSGYFRDSTQGFAWLAPHLIEVFFSTEHGLFLWHPILLFALAGFISLSRLDRRFSVLCVAGILLQAYIIASWSSWSQADSFGGRMFIATLPLFALGLGAFLNWALEKRATWAIWAMSICLILCNALFFIQYRLGFISMSGPYTLYQLTVGKLEMLVEIGKKVMYLITN